MPYWVQPDHDGGNWIERYYEPRMDIGQKRPYLQGQELTEEYKNSLSKVLRVGKPRKRSGPPDMIQDSDSAIWLVCEKLKDKLEELEPETHKYIPIHVKRDDDSADYGIYQMILLSVFLDAFDYDNTNFREGFGCEAAKKSNYSPFLSPSRKRTLRSDVIAGHHLWRGELGASRRRVFCSDELAAYVESEGLKGWALWKCETA